MEKERYISLRNIIWRILFAWKFIVIVAIIFGIMTLGVKYAYDTMQYNEIISGLGEQTELTVEEKKQIEKYQQLEEIVNDLEIYNENSFYMNVNPVKAYTINQVFTIQTEEDEARQIVKECVGYLNSEQFAEEILIKNDVDTEQIDEYIIFISELISISYELTENEEYNIVVIMLAEKDGFVANTQLTYEELLNEIETYILMKKDIVVTGQIIGEISLSTIRTSKSIITATLKEYKTEMTTLEETFSEAQKNYIASKNDELADETIIQNYYDISTPKISPKFAALGFLVGIVVACGIVLVKVLLANTLQEEKEISYIYDIKTLGIIRNRYEGKGIDKWLHQIYEKKYVSTEKEIDLALANICIACENANTKKIYILGDRNFTSKIQRDAYRQLIERIKLEGIAVFEGENILIDAKAHMQMCEIGTVVFVEIVDKSNYKEIEAKLIKTKDSDVEVLGCIVMV